MSLSTAAALVAAFCIVVTPLAGAAAEPAFTDARWVAPPRGTDPTRSLPLIRREFTLSARPNRAILRIVGLGDYDARINGRRLADTGLNQPWSQYEKTLYYRDFDVTRYVRAGANCIGVMLTSSFWHNPIPPAGRYNKDGPQRAAVEPVLLCAEVIATTRGGKTERIGTDTSWRTRPGPIAFSHVFAGEDYDATAEAPGWDRPGFDDAAWTRVREAAPPSGRLRPQTWPAVSAEEPFEKPTVSEAAPGVWVYSFPQNCASQLRVSLEGGQPGARVTFRCGEHRSDAGRLFGGYVVGCDVVTRGGRVDHQWVTFYLGMQFVEVTGAVPAGRLNPEGLPEVRALALVPVRTGIAPSGAFACSSPVLNDTHRIIDWAMRSNTSHVMTDCPHREKLGWLECAYLLAPTFLYRYDSATWLGKVAADVRDAQLPSGRVLTVAPSYPAGRFPNAFDWTVEWGAAAVLLPWHLYEWTGDLAVLRDNFDTMRRFTDHVTAEAVDGLAPGGLGDWYDYGHGHGPGPSRFTPVQLSATATWGLCARTVAQAADALGRADDAAAYRALHGRIAADFLRHYRDPATRLLRHSGSPQCAAAMALCADLVPAADRPGLVADIIADLERREYQQTPGDVGHVYFIRALSDAGRSDVLHRVYAREGTGSYGGIVKKGLTSLPETWDAMMDGYQSLNHCMLGHVMEWLYGYVGGIRQAPGSVGWQHALIAPAPGPVTHAETSVTTPRGRISSRWRIDGAAFTLTVTVPRGIRAEAVLPSGSRRPLRAGTQTLTEAWTSGP